MKPASAAGDRIYNGANDNGSGTVSVMEIAAALARLKTHPRRSILFITFFGEEEGLLGSAYYARHPIFPLAKSVANLNLEQLGRTDSKDGPRVGTLSMTGEAYSDITQFVEAAGHATGVNVRRSGANSELFFTASDNYPLAKAGVPSETLAVAFYYSDYHAVSDEWTKIDFDNMARIDRTVAAATLLLADSQTTPHWNDSKVTAPFRKARR
jgi:Zn-dependent M28 family amino/carboxypeptidase